MPRLAKLNFNGNDNANVNAASKTTEGNLRESTQSLTNSMLFSKFGEASIENLSFISPRYDLRQSLG